MSPVDWDTHWSKFGLSSRLNPAQAFRRRLVRKLLASTPPSTILDIGCGPGDLLSELSEQFPNAQLTGVDVSASGLEQAQARLPEASFLHADLTLGPAEKVQTEPASHAICTEVLEHVDEPATLLRNAAPLIAADGTLVVTVPGGPMSAFDKHLGHRRHFTKAALKDVLEDAGFELKKISAAGFPTFNLYRLTVLLRGEKLINDTEGSPPLLARLVMMMFSVLLYIGLPNSPWGWQIVALAKKRAA
ncbi:MAG: class I SAM-dependent methyltransferase [Rhodospirillaceae bacterium]|jgi:trans-aconitate methyltransferase|nr:class I SAM-dependent methyltransferase [Rhodospirillales bacterium]MBT3906717.1 class I SAM-dependent methyltransferase [Rhodospirillaceae bacterium]MBT4702744.1 class I SAM-dependent methyltransferase [Rhodospirillaceae bacterium]MBT5033479.1 class I SAM-dependent methyltransferase [Rhodospirillaceae bacterium]MBT6221327.1 class I SAM-dependent methyltransferase [Rhodospirillaceae bacterium]